MITAQTRPPSQQSIPADLPRDQVHVWEVDLDDFCIPTKQLLLGVSEPERAHARSFHHNRNGSAYLRRRFALRRILERYGSEIGTEPFEVGSHGKLALPQQSSIKFSSSSSGPRALIAVTAASEIGVDLERHRPVLDALELASVVLSQSEQDRLLAVLPTERNTAFLRLWTLKEAALKQLGVGLSVDPRAIETAALEPGNWRASVVLDAVRHLVAVSALEVADDLIASLAVPMHLAGIPCVAFRARDGAGQ